MNPIVESVLREYGPLGAMVLLFSYVIVAQDKRHQRIIERVQSEKDAQIQELKDEIKEMKRSFAEFSTENHITIRQNTQTLERNNNLVEDVRHLLREILEKRLES